MGGLSLSRLQRCRGYGTGVRFGEVLRGVLALVRTHATHSARTHYALSTRITKWQVHCVCCRQRKRWLRRSARASRW